MSLLAHSVCVLSQTLSSLNKRSGCFSITGSSNNKSLTFTNACVVYIRQTNLPCKHTCSWHFIYSKKQ